MLSTNSINVVKEDLLSKTEKKESRKRWQKWGGQCKPTGCGLPCNYQLVFFPAMHSLSIPFYRWTNSGVSVSLRESCLSFLNVKNRMQNSSTIVSFRRLIFLLCLHSAWIVVSSLWCCFAHILPWNYIYLPQSIDHIITEADSCSPRQNKFVPSNERRRKFCELLLFHMIQAEIGRVGWILVSYTIPV